MAKKKTVHKDQSATNVSSNGASSPQRLRIMKTDKLYIGGAFPRTESGRYISIEDSKGNHLSNVCRASRKDFRNAVVAARKAFSGWSGRTAYNRGQILYRMAEMMESRSAQFIDHLSKMGKSGTDAQKEVEVCIDRLVYFAGWTDKYSQIFSTLNPVPGSHVNFSVPVPMGVLSVIAPEKGGMAGMLGSIIPAICGGNTVVVLIKPELAPAAISFAEVLHTSDLPGGVVNILTGFREELLGHFSSHMDVNGMILCSDEQTEIKSAQEEAIRNLKRVMVYEHQDWLSDEQEHPYMILDTQEIKTTWHTVGK